MKQKSIIEKADSFICPGCGANMVFNPDAQSLVCPYCNFESAIEKNESSIKEYDFDLTERKTSTSWGKNNRVIHCDNCGAETVLADEVVAEFCAFCGSSHIVKNENSAGIAPESLVPFKISRENADSSFIKWIKHKFWAPRKLKTNYQPGRMNGVYIPFWTFDSDTISNYSANIGTYYYETETHWVNENGESKKKTNRVRKTHWEYMSACYSHYFDDILINASKNVDEKLMTKIEPFNLDELAAYDPGYLSGFMAEKYSIDIKDGWQQAKNIMNVNLKNSIKKQIVADITKGLSINTSFESIKYKHILLPIWISTFTYKNKTYKYLINGQTGEVQGKYPLSFLKIFSAVLISIIAFFTFINLVF